MLLAGSLTISHMSVIFVVALVVILTILYYYMAKTVHCPHCFDSFDSRNIDFRCVNPRCRLENDELLARHLGIPERVINHAFNPSLSEIKKG